MFGKLVKILLFLGVPVFFGFVAFKFHQSIQPIPPPVLEETWWGPGKAGKDDTAIKPFKIQVPDQVLGDLRERLQKARPFTPPLENSKHHYGINAVLLKEIVDFWKTKYDWRTREKYLNRYPQFKTQIQGLDIHYIHVKPQNVKGLKVLPLVLIHGWPGSVREFYELIPKLTTPRKDRNFVFEVIVPSLPGYGFSQGASKQGLGAPQMAVVFKNLMERIGVKKYYVQGGDWGAFVSAAMAAMYPDRVLGAHSDMCNAGGTLANAKLFLGAMFPSLVVDDEHRSWMYPLSDVFYKMMLEMGYFHIQATKPDTVGVGLNDSPVGLAAYILEKFIAWTNMEHKNRDDGGLKLKFKYEDLLDNVMIYWVTGSITTSVRLYAETMNLAQMKLEFERVPILVPSACIKFKHELLYLSDYILKDRFVNLVQSTHHEDGGHFSAFEMPEVMADDIYSAVEKMEHFHRK